MQRSDDPSRLVNVKPEVHVGCGCAPIIIVILLLAFSGRIEGCITRIVEAVR